MKLIPSSHTPSAQKKIHSDWVFQVQFYPELNGFVSCSTDCVKSLAIGDIQRNTVRHVRSQRGVKCFEFCRRPSFLITGGRDKVLRLWNPYVLSKPAASLVGHNASISKLTLNHDMGYIISMSDDKVVKVWSARTLQCLQTLVDKVNHRPENIISAIYYDNVNRLLIQGHDQLEAFAPQEREKTTISRSHEAPVVAALYNENFNQVVSGCVKSSVRVWNVSTGEKSFMYNGVHGDLEITAMNFDKIGRRLVTASRDGIIRMWNFNNGQMLQQMQTTKKKEITQLIYVETTSDKLIISVGWDRRISMFRDEPGNFSSEPLRELIASAESSNGMRGHTDDILCIDFLPPNTLVTGGLDGVLAVWNADSGHCRWSLRDPIKNLRSPVEQGIERVCW